MLGRLQVRIHNWNTTNTQLLPTELLIWAWTIQPIYSAALFPICNQTPGPYGTPHGGIGTSPTGILETKDKQVGTTVFGFFLDEMEAQRPVILGTFGSNSRAMCNNGREIQGELYNDITPLATGQNIIIDHLIGPEPSSSFKAKYPYNKVTTTEQGHVIEVDDTPNHERIRIFHKQGTYSEINEQGRLVIKCVNQRYDVTVSNHTIWSGANITIEAGANINIEAPQGNINLKTDMYSTSVNEIVTKINKIIAVADIHVHGGVWPGTSYTSIETPQDPLPIFPLGGGQGVQGIGQSVYDQIKAGTYKGWYVVAVKGVYASDPQGYTFYQHNSLGTGDLTPYLEQAIASGDAPPFVDSNGDPMPTPNHNLKY
jgi:hypothetical protein